MRKINTYEEFIQKLKEINNDIEIESEYNGLSTTKVKCKCLKCNFEWETFPYILLDGHGCKFCNKREFGEFKYKIGDTITSNGRNLQIIGMEYRKTHTKNRDCYQNRKYYNYRCSDCGYEDWIIEYSLSDMCKYGCKSCARNIVVTGVNDIQTLLPNIAKLFVDKDLPRIKSRGSREIAEFICPDCGRIHSKRINTVCTNGLSCICGDSISYPNKFIYALLESIGVVFETEKSFDWSDNRKYDAFILNYGNDIIVEMNGSQHYLAPFRSDGKSRSVDEEKRNDEYKRHLAIDNGIAHYFEIDSSVSNLDFIKNSIIGSGLLTVLDVDPDNVDWMYCDSFATSNLIKKMCDDFDCTDMTAADIANKYKKNIKTVQRYLRKGKALGWCNYSGEINKKRSGGSTKKKPVYCKNVDMIFDSAKDAAVYLGLHDQFCDGKAIRKAISENRPFMGYEFEYIMKEKADNEVQSFTE